VLDVIDDEKLEARAEELGSRIKSRLTELALRVPHIAEVRRPGSMVAVEFLDPNTKEPATDYTKRVQAKALKRGLILLTCRAYGNVLRFLYPLTTPDAVFAEALDILEDALLNA
jgi:4-aminobutyrate aminotransferase